MIELQPVSRGRLGLICLTTPGNGVLIDMHPKVELQFR